jgi:hypothetical protein
MNAKGFIAEEERFVKNGALFLKKESNLLRREEKFIINEVFSLLHFKFLFRFRYPKLALFGLCIFLAYFVFADSLLSSFLGHLGSLSYLGVFVAGVLFSFGFTSPFSAGLLLVMNPENVFLAAIIGGIGCLIGDMVIYRFVKVSFEKEFTRLRKERPFRFMRSELKKFIAPKLWHYFLFVLAGFFFASPFIPDEAAVTLLAGMSSIDAKKLALISFVCNTIGILVLLLV